MAPDPAAAWREGSRGVSALPNRSRRPDFSGTTFTERHFSIRTLAELWAFSEDTVRRLFQDEPGVVRIGKAGRRDGKRDYETIRIPESLAERKYRELMKG